MARLLAFLCVFAVSMTATAKPAERLYRASSDEMVQVMNKTYPDLKLTVVEPNPENAVAVEIDSLRAAIQGQMHVPNGSLLHLACCNPRCGGGPECRQQQQ